MIRFSTSSLASGEVGMPVNTQTQIHLVILDLLLGLSLLCVLLCSGPCDVMARHESIIGVQCTSTSAKVDAGVLWMSSLSCSRHHCLVQLKMVIQLWSRYC